MNLGVGELQHSLKVLSRPVSMKSSKYASRPVERLGLGIAGLIFALGLCLPATGQPAPVSGTTISQDMALVQHAAQTQQSQSGGLRDPERDRDRPERRGQAQLMLSPEAATVAPGDEVSMRLLVVGAQELLRLPVTLRYDPQVVRVVSVHVGSAWKGGTAPTLMYDTSRPGKLVVGLARLGREATPITGAGEVLRITFEAVAPGETELGLERYALLGRRARSQVVAAKPAKVSVQ